MHKLYELKEKLMDELGAYSENGKFSKDDVEAIKYVASAIDHICNIVERADEEYSMAGGAYNGGSYNGGFYRGSYARGGNRGGNRSYARRRDSMGRYSSTGYSRAEDDMIEDLREMLQEAPDDRTRQEVQKLIQKLEQM